MFTNSYIDATGAKTTIIALTKKTAQSQFEIGEILKKLKDKVETFKFDGWKKKGSNYQAATLEYKNLIENDLPFGKVVANKLVQIASDKMIKKHLFEIPFAYNTMYELIGMIPKQWKFYFKKGLNGKSTAKDIKAMKKAWLEKTQPKDQPVTTETIAEIKDLVKGLEKKKTPAVDFSGTDFEMAFAEELVSVKVVNTNMTSEQLNALQSILDKAVEDFQKSEKIQGNFQVSCNPNVLSDQLLPEIDIAA